MGQPDTGHPEHGHTAGVETTTARSARASATPSGWRWRPAANAVCSTRTPSPASIFDHDIFVFASDGDLEEGER